MPPCAVSYSFHHKDLAQKGGVLSMGRAIFVTSFKGGVGKTTVSANLASALTYLGKSVLTVDADFSNRCLDIVLGLENNSVFDCYDILKDGTAPSDAIIRSEKNPLLSLLPAPANFSGEKLEQERFISLFNELKSRYDYILVDSSAEISETYLSFAAVCDDAIVVSFHQSTAIRAAEKTATKLAELGFSNIRLVVNIFHKEDSEAGRLPSVYDIITRAHIRLIGVVPYDSNVSIDQEAGRVALENGAKNPKKLKKLKEYERAFLNIARRVCGEQVPLLKGVYKKKGLKRLFSTT